MLIEVIPLNSKAQSSLEYLLTYGWALVLISVVIGVLIFLIGSPESVAFSSSDPTKILMKGGALLGTDADIKMQNITGGAIDVTTVTMTSNYSAASCLLNGNPVTSGAAISPAITVPAGSELYIECSNVGGNGSGTIDIDYTDFAGLQRSVGITGGGSSGAAALTIPTGYVAYYRFENNLNDETGTWPGTWVGSPSPNYSERFPGNYAVEFDGVSERVEVMGTASHASFNFPQNGTYTLSAWAKTEGSIVPGKNQAIVGKGEDQYRLTYTPANNWDIIMKRADGRWEYSLSAGSLDTWTHVVGVRDGADEYLYINGQLANDTPPDVTAFWSGVRDNSFNLEIGRDSKDTSEIFNGFVDDVVIYNRALNGTEVLQIYNAQKP
jgi:hypothetical protein